MKFLSALVLFLATLSGAQAQSMGRRPLGLEWGQGLEDTKKLGVEATTQANDEFGKAVIYSLKP
jgi:hypothetical protein